MTDKAMTQSNLDYALALGGAFVQRIEMIGGNKCNCNTCPQVTQCPLLITVWKQQDEQNH